MLARNINNLDLFSNSNFEFNSQYLQVIVFSVKDLIKGGESFSQFRWFTIAKIEL